MQLTYLKVQEGRAVTKPASTRRSVRPRREDVLLGLLVANFIVSVGIAGSFAMIAHQFEPQGSLFGLPMRIWTCGRSYRTDPSNTSVWTRAQIDAQIAPGLAPVVFEPVIGQIPLFAPLAGRRDYGGFQVCDKVVYLHVGPDAYRAYSLLGGP